MIIILFLCCYPALIFICVTMANEVKPKKNIILRVTLPYSARLDPRVQEICRNFKRNVWLSVIPLTLVLLPAFFIEADSVQITVFLTWILVAILVPNLIFIKYYNRLRALKRAEGWFTPYAGQTVVDLKADAKIKKPLSKWWFAPALVICLFPLLMVFLEEHSANRTGSLLLMGTFALTAILGIAFYPVIFRQKADIVDSDSRINAALTNVRRYNWAKVWISFSWLSAFLCLAMWLFREKQIWWTVSLAIYTLAILYISINAEFVTRAAQERISEGSGMNSYVDEDAYWIFGSLYYNPADRHVFINDRVGMGMGVNVGRPAGKIVMGLSALALLAMPFIGVWMVRAEFSPREAELREGICYFDHVSESYEIPLDSIITAELIEELPRSTRTNGTGLDGLLEGQFSADGYGRCRFCLDPRDGPFIVLETDTQTYIFNLMDDEKTINFYNEIRSFENA